MSVQPERIIFGFHTILARLRADPKSVLEVFLDEARKDARAKDFAATVDAIEHTHDFIVIDTPGMTAI